MRTWSGVLWVEGIQTGDGRVIALEAVTWDGLLPCPLQWAPENQGSHDEYVVVGTVETIVREGSTIRATGTLADDTEYGAQVRDLMDREPPLASGCSIVMDDVAVEYVDNTDGASADSEDGGMIIVGGAKLGVGIVLGAAEIEWGPKLKVRSGWSGLGAMLAAAGEPDPVDAPVDGESASDDYLMRCVRGRLRAVTLVDVPAFVEAFIALDPVETPSTGEPGEQPPAVAGEKPADGEKPVAAALAASSAVAPAASWFSKAEPDIGDESLIEQVNDRGEVIGYGVPLTITDDGQVFGHVAFWGACHIGYGSTCVSPPESHDDYALFHLGTVRCDDGVELPVGTLAISTDHPDLLVGWKRAQDAYAHTGLAWADVRAFNGKHGIWVAGALRPEITDAQLRVLRASKLSGDWRQIAGMDGLQMVAVLAVNHPGFPIARRALAASGLAPTVGRPVLELGESGVERMIGVNIVASCHDCGSQTLTVDPSFEIFERLSALEGLILTILRRTEPLRTQAAEQMRARLAHHV